MIKTKDTNITIRFNCSLFINGIPFIDGAKPASILVNYHRNLVFGQFKRWTV